MARDRIAYQGLPARICWLEYGERARAGFRFNQLVAEGKVKAPIVIGRDHLDCGSVASPNRETEAMKDGSDAVADLADPQRSGEHSLWRNLGQLSPRRRCRDGILSPCWSGDCR